MKVAAVKIEHGGRQARFWAMSAAMLVSSIGGVVLALAALQPPLPAFLHSLVIYVVYADAFALVATLVIAWPLGTSLSQLGVPFLAQVIAFAFVGALIAIPFAIVGLIVDGSPVVGIVGFFFGVWSCGIGRLLYTPISRSRASAIVGNAVPLLAGVIGIPIAVQALVG